MAVTEKNGQASMEEILASIRRIIAEEPAGAVPLIDLNRKPNGRTGGDGENGDFELPSMFRHRRPTLIEGRQPLYGRLTDALRQAAPVRPKEQTNGRPAAVSQATVANGVRTARSQQTNGQPIEPQATPAEAFGSRPQPATPAPSATLSELTPRRETTNGTSQSAATTATINGTATLNGQSPGAAPQPQNGHAMATSKQPAAAPTPVNGSAVNGANIASKAVNGSSVAAKPTSVAPQPDPSTAAQQPRVMAPFRDVRMAGMGSMSAKSKPPAKPVAASPAPQPTETSPRLEPAAVSDAAVAPAAGPTTNGVDFSTIVPLQMGLPGRQEPGDQVDVAAMPSAAEAIPTQDAPHSVAGDSAVTEAADAAPPPLPDEGVPANGRIEDATADLLRPMLRQWLAENMPRMVEKALHIEVAQSVQLTNKPGQN